ncbi:MAG: hypothetical protein AAF355_14380 [Myxococcota bacterium]
MGPTVGQNLAFSALFLNVTQGRHVFGEVHGVAYRVRSCLEVNAALCHTSTGACCASTEFLSQVEPAKP